MTTKLTNRSRLGSRGIGGKIRVRILRPWRGYRVGDVITPPGGLRRELLLKQDGLGNKFAEEVKDVAPGTTEIPRDDTIPQETAVAPADGNAAPKRSKKQKKPG